MQGLYMYRHSVRNDTDEGLEHPQFGVGPTRKRKTRHTYLREGVWSFLADSYALRRRYHAIIHQLCLSREPKIFVRVHSTPKHRTGMRIWIQTGAYQCHCAIVTIAIFTTMRRANEPHTSACSLNSRRAQSPRSWAGSKVVARTVLPCAHTARGQQRVKVADSWSSYQWRTGEEGRHAPPKARFLVVVVDGLHIVSCTRARPCSDFGLRTEIGRLKLSDM